MPALPILEALEVFEEAWCGPQEDIVNPALRAARKVRPQLVAALSTPDIRRTSRSPSPSYPSGQRIFAAIAALNHVSSLAIGPLTRYRTIKQSA